MKKTISILAIAGLVLALAPAAQAASVEFVGDASALLNLSGRDVLAAVNFYDPDRVGLGNLTVDNPIQGVTFDNFRVNVDDTGSPIALGTGATLSTVIAQIAGREFFAAAGSGTYGSQIGTFSPQNADNIQAERLANGGAFYDRDDPQPSTMTFAFGAGYANTTVEVQMLGGGIWATSTTTTYPTQIEVSVGASGPLATLEDWGYNLQLHTFDATTDGSGNLQLDLQQGPTPPATDSRYNLIAGVTVTAVPEPATMSLLAIGGLALIRRRRRA